MKLYVYSFILIIALFTSCSKNRQQKNLLIELNQEGTTIVMVIHSDRDSHYVHRVVNLFDGQIITESQNRAVGATI